MKYKLGDVLLKYIRGPFGSALKRPEMKDHGIPVYEQQNAIYNHREFRYFVDEEKYNELKRFTVETGDLIISCSGTLGKVSLIKGNDPKGIISQALLILRPNTNIILPEYLYYFFSSKYGYNSLVSRSSGSVQVNMAKREVIEGIEMNIPSLEVQKEIIQILNKLDGKINVNSQINNNLLELSKQLYMNTFSDNSDFEEIKLGELCNIKYGKGLPTTKILDNGYPVYGGNGIIGYYDSKMYDESQVLISCRGAASGKVILSKPNSFVTNNSLILEVDRLYHHYLKEYCFLNPFYAYTTGSAQPQITIDNIKDIIVKIPDSKTLEEFNYKCEAIERKYFLNIEQNETLEQLRDTLLPKLMNAEIDLDNIEI